MKKFVFGNGLRLIIERKPGESVSVFITVNAGSNYEKKGIFGVSHFIEHMLFEGTKKRRTSTIISNEIEKLGGELNAYTSNERACFYIKVQKKHFDRALDVLADIMQHPLFDEKAIEKERRVILKEINLVTDEPRFHQWVLFQKTLFRKYPARNPTYGLKKDVQKIKKRDLVKYYKEHYLPNNVIIAVVGDVSGVKEKVDKAFKDFKKGKAAGLEKVKEPGNKRIFAKERKRILNSYMVLGYKTVKRDERESYVLDVIKALLARGQSGKIIEEIRNKRGLAYEVNVAHDAMVDYGMFAVYLNTDKKNIPDVVKIIMGVFSGLKKVSGKEIKEAKGYLEGQFVLGNEDTHELAGEIGFWESVGDAKLVDSYIRNIKKVGKRDIVKVAKKYLNKNYALAVVEQS